MTRHVKIWVASDDQTFYMKQERFIDIIAGLMGNQYIPILENACSEYGGYFILDRQQGTCRHLTLKNNDKKLTSKDIVALAAQEQGNAVHKSIPDMYRKFGDMYDKISRLRTDH